MIYVNAPELAPPLASLGPASEPPEVWFVTTTVRLFEAPPPGAGFAMPIERLPAALRLPEGTVAITWLAETYVEEIETEFMLTVEVGRKLEPSNSIWVVGAPTDIVDGIIDAKDGAKLLTENEAEVEVPPPGVGFETVMAWVPDTISLLAGIAALS